MTLDSVYLWMKKLIRTVKFCNAICAVNKLAFPSYMQIKNLKCRCSFKKGWFNTKLKKDATT